MALPMPPENIKQTASIFNAGRTAMMIPGIPLETVQTPTFPSKPAYSRRNQTYSRYAQAQPARRFGCILGEAHATWLQTLYSRPLPFPKKQGIMVQNFLISSTSLSLMSRCLIPDKESRSMSSLSSPAVCSMRQKGKDFTSILQLMNILAGATWKPLRNTAPIPPLDSLST